MSSSPRTTTSARLVKKGDTRYTFQKDVVVPDPKEGQVLVKIQAAGFCHTDMMIPDGTFGGSFPITGSHEPAGVIVALGSGVGTSHPHLHVGQRVASLCQVTRCGVCYDCRNLDPAYCPQGNLAGVTTDGAFAGYLNVLADNTAILPDELSWQNAASLTCAGVTIFMAIKRAGLKAGEVIGISGLGALGHLGVQFAKAMGLVVVGIDARPEPLELCQSFKHAPDLLVDASKTSADQAKSQLKTLLGDVDRLDGVDALVLTSEGDKAVRYGFDMIRRHGRFVLVSQPPTLDIPFADLVFKNVSVKGSLQGNGRDLQDCVDTFVRERIECRVETWSFEKGEKGLDGMWEAQEKHGRVGKNVVLMSN